MTTSDKLVIEPLHSIHSRSSFRCGIDALDIYIRKQASQDLKRRISRVFVATEPTTPSEVIGYYTLRAFSIELSNLPESLAKKLPRHPIPAALIGRLAVRNGEQGQGIGRMLLADAIKRTLAISSEIAIYAMVVDAINEDAQRFYEQFRFSALSCDSRRLFLPLKSIRRSVRQTFPPYSGLLTFHADSLK